MSRGKGRPARARQGSPPDSRRAFRQTFRHIFRRTFRPLMLLAMGTVLLCLLAGIRRVPYIFDEGYATYGAARILDGQVPYRDFWLLYAPAQFYVLAGVFKLLGASLMVARLYDVLTRLAIVVIVTLIARRLASPWLAVLPAAVATLLLAEIEYYGYAMYPALAFALLAVLLLLVALEGREKTWLLSAGVATGAATLFRHDIGIYCAASAAIVLVAFGAPSGAPVPSPWIRRLGRLVPYVAGAAIVVAPVTAALLAVVPGRELWQDLIVFPTTILNMYRSYPYPSLAWAASSRQDFDTAALFYVPPIVFLLGAASLFWRRSAATALLVLLGFCFFRQALNRADAIHMLPANLLAPILLVAILFQAASRVLPRALVGLCVAGLAAGGDPWLAEPARRVLRLLGDPQSHQRYSLERGRGITAIQDQQQAINYVRSHTAPGEPIFVGNTWHDRTVANDVVFYFLADRPCGTRYHDLCPGVATTRPVQETIVSELERNRVNYVVLFSGWDMVREPNASSISSGVTFLDDSVRARFAGVARFGDYTILRRKG